MNLKYKFLFALLIFIALFFRFYDLKKTNIFNDELDVGYSAYSLLKTGKDIKGNFLPVYIQTLEESRAPFLIYSTIPFVYLFGLNHFSIKLVPLLYSLLTAIYFYKLIKILSKDNYLALICSSVLLITPYFFHYSRHAFEITSLLFLTISATFYFFKFLTSEKIFHIFISIFFFSLTFYTYNTGFIFTPLLFLYLLITNKNQIFAKKFHKKILSAFIFGLILMTPIIHQTFFGKVSSRFKLISIFSDQNTFNQIIDKRTLYPNNSPLLDRLFYNRPIYYIKNFYQNYLKSISLSTLFFEADPNPRHSPPGFGFFPSVYIAYIFIYLLKRKQTNSADKLFIFWLVISPIASSLTQNGGNHATRLAYLILPIIYFTSKGISSIKSLYLFSSLGFILLFQLSAFYYYYFTIYPSEQYQSWQNHFQQIFTNIPLDYNRLFISDLNFNTLKPYLFYQKIDPKLIQSNFSNLSLPMFDNIQGYQLNNTFFVNNWGQNTLSKVENIAKPKDIFILFQLKDIPGDFDLTTNSIDGFKTINQVFNPDGTINAQVIQKI